MTLLTRHNSYIFIWLRDSRIQHTEEFQCSENLEMWEPYSH